MQTQTVQIELADGTVTEPIRITYPDKKAANKTAQARGWDDERDAVTINAFIAYLAAKRTGIYQGNFEDWDDHDLVDFYFETTAVDPTQPGA